MFVNRRQFKWKNFKVAILLTSAILIVVFAAIFATEVDKLFAGETATIYAVFDNVRGLNSGAPIRFAGLQIGSVGSIQIRADGKINVALSLDRDKLTFLKRDATAEILTLGLLGDKYISLTSGSKDDSLKDGDAIPGEIPAELQEIVATTQKSLNRMGQFIEKLAMLVDTVETGQGTLGKLITDPDVFNNLETLTAALTVVLENLSLGKGLLGKLVTEEDLYDNLANAAGDIQHFAESLRNSKGSIHRFIEDGQLYENLNRTTERLNTILARIENGEGLLGKLINEDRLIWEIRETLKAFRQLLTDIRYDPQRYFDFELY
jgi:phospholipid/cholesterol/gamma-HCH transport system substrate-binding protein